MSRRARAAGFARRRPEIVAALVLTLLVSSMGIAWVLRYRRGAVVDVDEAAYLGAVWDDTTGLQHSGLGGLWQAWTMHAGFAPLVPLSAMPVQLLVGGRHLLAAFAVLDAWYAVLLVATAFLARRLVSGRWAVLAVVVAGCLPGIVDATRTFHFALAAAALLTATAAALLASDRLRSTRWAIVVGVLAGLTLLSRSVMVALLPGVVAGAALLVLASPARRRAARNLALALLAGLALAATWYLPNLGAIWTYLTEYGYGTSATDYGTVHAPWDPAWWTAAGLQAVRSEIWLPMAIVLLASVGALAVQVVFRGRRRRSVAALMASPRRVDGAVCACIVGCGYLALSSSPDLGTGFELPLLPAVCCLAAAGISGVHRPAVRRAGAGVLVALSALALALKSGATDSLTAQASVNIPVIGSVTVLDARGDIQRYTQTFRSGSATSLLMSAADHEWQKAAAVLEARLTTYAMQQGRLPVICAATRDPFVSTNHLQLAARYWFDAEPPLVAQLNPHQGGDSVANYRVRLSDPRFGQPNMLITGDPAARDFAPHVTQAFAVQAARELGFQPAFTAVLPGGRHLQVWWLLRGPVLTAG